MANVTKSQTARVLQKTSRPRNRLSVRMSRIVFAVIGVIIILMMILAYLPGVGK